MIKIYKSYSDISINILTKVKKNVHISFNANSNGSSTYATSDPNIQYGLEHHYRFNDLFRLVESYDEEQKAEEKKKEEEQKKADMVKVTVSDLMAARDYLADNYGISRTQLRNPAAIVNAAKKFNIEFVGIDQADDTKEA